MNGSILNVATYEKQKEILKIVKNEYHKLLKRYTVKIDKNNSNPYNRITYIDDAVGMTPAHMNFSTGVFEYGDWKDVWFIKDNYPVMLKYDGTIDYKLNPNDYTKKEDGTNSDIANTSYNGNAMSRFPKVYLSFRENGNYEYISVCEGKYDETYEPIGFVNDSGSVVDEIFLSMFEGWYDGTRMRSLSGKTPTDSQTLSTEVHRAQSNGNGWYIRTWAQRQMLNALLTIISKSDNSQVAFGNGRSNRGSFIGSTTINTGTIIDKGQFFGYNADNAPAGSTGFSEAVKVFHIENWWGNISERIDGLLVYQGNIYTKMSGPYMDPDLPIDLTDYTLVYTFPNLRVFTPDYYVESYGANCKCNNTCGRLPIGSKSPGGTAASSSTFLCDYVGVLKNSGGSGETEEQKHYFANVGGYWQTGSTLYPGYSYIALTNSRLSAQSSVGTALSYMSQS